MPFQGVKAPEEPAGYDPEDKFKDPVLYYRHRNAVVAREFIRVEEAKVSRANAVCSLSLSLSLTLFFLSPI